MRIVYFEKRKITMKILLVASMLFLTACSTFIAKPEITLKDVKLVGVGAEGFDLDFYFSVRNPNSFDLKLKDYTYDVKIMSLLLAQGSSQATQNFYANSTSDLLLPAKIPYSGLIDILKRRPNPDAIPYQLHADLNIGGAIGTTRVPIDKSGTFKVPKEYYPNNLLKKVGDFLKGLEKEIPESSK
ncbi:MAG: lipoprotein [Geobacteraceae bacterium]|nr:lipoprotein [Geobacteraceae bacterium]